MEKENCNSEKKMKEYEKLLQLDRESRKSKKRDLHIILSVFVGTLFLFYKSFVDVEIIIVPVICIMALVFMSAGKAVSMLLLGYDIPLIMFIPYFGVIHEGEPVNFNEKHKIISLFSTVLPIYFIGLILMLLFIYLKSGLLYVSGYLFLFISILNLLPIYPLVGGEIINLSLFNVKPEFRVVFYEICFLATIGLFLYLENYIIMFILLISIGGAISRCNNISNLITEFKKSEYYEEITGLRKENIRIVHNWLINSPYADSELSIKYNTVNQILERLEKPDIPELFLKKSFLIYVILFISPIFLWFYVNYFTDFSIVKTGKKVNVQSEKTEYDMNKYKKQISKLVHSIINNKTDEFFEVIKSGVNLNQKFKIDNKQYTLVSLAAVYDRVEMLEELIKNGAKIIGYKNSESPMYYAIVKSHAECVRLLLEYDFEIDSSVSKSSTLLYQALSRKKYEIIELLLEYNANIDLKDGLGRTPLIYAICVNDIKMVSILMDFGANPFLRDKSGNNAEYYAMETGNKEIVLLIKDYIKEYKDQVD